MKISLNWLRDFVALPPPEELARRLTFAGLEIEGVESPGKALHGVLVGQIKESKPHPNAERLSVCAVDLGQSAPLTIVCGAKNYKVGDKVPVATPGAVLAGDKRIEKASLRGVESFGMLCSAKELGLAEEAEGLLILDPALKPGTPLAQALGLDDTLFEVNVTPNRSDCLSHLGIAREVAALTGAALKMPAASLKEKAPKVGGKASVQILDAARCPRYAARVIEGLRIGPSPSWLSARLQAVGIRSINNVVDVTNYVLLELGHPLHAFDLDKLQGASIVVRAAKAGEKLATLDGKERSLSTEDLCICDAKSPVALAGVMGGASSEVSEKTTRVLLESAYFEPRSIRRTARRHGLHTEASHRFERGADVGMVLVALDRAAALIAELASGQVLEGRIDVYPKPLPERSVTLADAKPGELLGIPVAAEEGAKILGSLGIEKVERLSGATRYRIPTHRVDLEVEVDLVEEIARVRGYEAIPTALPRGLSSLSPETAEREVTKRVRSVLSGLGFDEVLNYSFVARELVEAVEGPGGRSPIALKNPLTSEQGVMRTSVLSSLLQNVAYNLRRQVGDFRLYELGRVYLPRAAGDTPAEERQRVAGVLVGRRLPKSWTSGKEAVDFYDAKGAVEALLAALKIEGELQRVERIFLHPRSSAELIIGGEPAGLVGEIHPGLAERLGLPRELVLFELEFGALVKAANLVPRAAPIPRFPAVLRDMALVVDNAVPAAEVGQAISGAGKGLVEDAVLFDVFRGGNLPAGKKNLAFSIRYRASDRTLTDEEANAAHDRILKQLGERFGAALR